MKRLFAALALLVLVFGSPLAQDEPETVCEEGFRLVIHALGEACVPEKPVRVVALDMTIIELLLIAGNPPIAGSELVFDTYIQMLPILAEPFAGVLENGSDIGYPPNIEVILQTKPDLIIGPRDFFTELLYPELNKITPTVLYDITPGDWRGRLIFAGEVLGLSELAESLLADFDARVAEFRSVMPETEVPFELSLVRTWPGQIGLVLEGIAAANVLADTGVGRPESQRMDYEYVVNELGGRPELLISEEELLLADGDVIFVFGDAPGLMDNPLWNALPAVIDGRAFEVGYYWWGDSLLSAHAMLDDLFTYVAQTEPELANPFKDGISLPEKELEATPES